MPDQNPAPVAVVTGAGSGFGLAISAALERRGWRVIAGMRRPDAPLRCPSTGGMFRLDVCSADDRAALSELIRTTYDGRLDLLVNNAGCGLFGALEDTTEAQLRDQFEVNLFAPALLIRELLPALRASRGRIITISSALADWPMPLTSGYCASKSAMDALSASLRLELASHDVQVAVVAPGAHATPFLDKAGWPDPEAHASSVHQDASARYRTFRDAQRRRKNLPGPEQVARVVARLATCARMPPKVRVGWDAVGIGYARRLLPTGVLVALKRHLFRAWFVRLSPDGSRPHR